jgi:transcriptional regulator with XRE-family HTH domain
MPYHPIDVQVGGRLRQRRTLLGMSQMSLGKAVGLTFQQIQKYERGANRLGASKLYEFAKVLDVPVSYFFETMPAEATRFKGRHGTPQTGRSNDPLVKRESLELVRAYYKIRNTSVRKAIANAVRSLRRE